MSREKIIEELKAVKGFKSIVAYDDIEDGKKYDVVTIYEMTDEAEANEAINRAAEVTDCIVFSNAFPFNRNATIPSLYGNAYKACLKAATKYVVRTHPNDTGICVIYPNQIREDAPEYVDQDYNKNVLKNGLIFVRTIEETVLDYTEIEPVVVDEGGELSDKEIKAAYKAKTGKQRIAKSVSIEDMKEALND